MFCTQQMAYTLHKYKIMCARRHDGGKSFQAPVSISAATVANNSSASEKSAHCTVENVLGYCGAAENDILRHVCRDFSAPVRLNAIFLSLCTRRSSVQTEI